LVLCANLAHQGIVAHVYTYRQEMIGKAVSGELPQMTSLLGQALTPEVEKQLEAPTTG
jgi:hypothetical protein